MKTVAEMAESEARQVVHMALHPPDDVAAKIRHLVAVQGMAERMRALAICRDVETAVGLAIAEGTRLTSLDVFAAIRTIAEMIQGDPNEHAEDQGAKEAATPDRDSGHQPD